MSALFDNLKHEVIEINGRAYPFPDLLGIDPTNLSDEYSQQAAIYGYIGTLSAQAEADFNNAKADKDVVYAEVEMVIRRELASTPDVKTTEGLVKSLVLTDERYMDAILLENTALSIWKKLRSLTDALRQRGEMMVSLGAMLRQEYSMTNMALYNTKEQLLNLRHQDGQ